MRRGYAVSRRGLLTAAGAGVAVAGGAAAAGFAAGSRPHPDAGSVAIEPFHGDHQAGILTPAQDRLHFAAFDVTTDSRDALVDLLKRWTTVAERLTRGRPTGEDNLSSHAPPDDTGEAMDLGPSRLTITFGFGPTLFRTVEGRDRFGLAERQPAALTRLPQFRGDRLDPACSDGDLCIQACADDPLVALHAVRNLARIAFGTATVRWSQVGFGRAPGAAGTTPRNLFGFKDGTANLSVGDAAELDRHVWVPAGRDPAADWLAGGTFLVARRIAMHIETWDRAALMEQEAIIGRTKAEGAPLSGGDEFSAPDFTLAGSAGQPLIAPRSHLTLAHPSRNGGVRLLRRGYAFADGSTSLGRLDAGEFFLAFVTDPRTHFIPMQTKLATQDLLAEYLQHTGSGLWAIPPGVRPGEFVGQRLFT